jgi:hypothetical protein
MAALSETAYGKLLSKVRPRVIRTEAENERALAELEALDNLEELERPLVREEVELVSWVRSSATFGPTASRGRWPY